MKLSREELLSGARSVAMGIEFYGGDPSGDLVITAPSDAGGWKAAWVYTHEGERKVGTTLNMSDSDVVLRALILAAFNE